MESKTSSEDEIIVKIFHVSFARVSAEQKRADERLKAVREQLTSGLGVGEGHQQEEDEGLRAPPVLSTHSGLFHTPDRNPTESSQEACAHLYAQLRVSHVSRSSFPALLFQNKSWMMHFIEVMQLIPFDEYSSF
ncbi:unnamed protein product [Lampetra planeri]